MFCHRNTVSNRLHRFAKLTGLDPRFLNNRRDSSWVGPRSTRTPSPLPSRGDRRRKRHATNCMGEVVLRALGGCPVTRLKARLNAA
ncbi:helix-turn-helix domain-containing protein [Rhodococcus sp. 2.95]